MNAYFQTESRQLKLLRAATRWIGTPFVAHGAIRGAGVDCVNLVAQLLIACGHAPGYDMPEYAMDGGKHNRTSQLCDYLDSRNDFALVNEPFQIGDVVCFTIGRSSHHCGIKLDKSLFIHALFGRKVSYGSLTDGVFKRSLTAVYRPLEVQR